MSNDPCIFPACQHNGCRDGCAGDELPPLPDPGTRTDWHIDGCGEPAYTADQMRNFARAAVLQEREACAVECERLANGYHSGSAIRPLLKATAQIRARSTK